MKSLFIEFKSPDSPHVTHTLLIQIHGNTFPEYD